MQYLDLNGNGVYDPGVDALWGSTGQRWFLDLAGSGLYLPGTDALWNSVVGWYIDLNNNLGSYVENSVSAVSPYPIRYWRSIPMACAFSWTCTAAGCI